MLQSPSAYSDQEAIPKIALKDRRYHAGSLTYTVTSLTILFAWLLWGDFCFMLMETVAPTILPLKLKALGVSNWVMALIMTTLPGILNMTVCPWVSYKSDRYRGRWGRRIPFILWTMPFLVLSLGLLGWSVEISALLRNTFGPLNAFAPTTLTVILIGIFMVAFQFFNMFVGSVYYYLFNDVVPPQFVGRFMGLFRFVTVGASSVYSMFIFKYAESYMREIFTGIALLYFVGFGLMCLFVKEGEYPPPPPENKSAGAGIRSFLRESYSHPLYWYFYLMYACIGMSDATGIFGVFFFKEMGLSLGQIGQLGALGGAASLVATYFISVYVDRWHPLRIMTYMTVFAALSMSFSGWIWIPVTLPAKMFFWLTIGMVLVSTFSGTLKGLCGFPMFMRLLPHSRFGQLSSAAALIRSVGMIVAGILAGVFMDTVMWLCHGSDFAYRFLFLWSWLFYVLIGIFLVLAYREWRRLGGDDHYRPPAPWNPNGFEELSEKVVSVPMTPRYLSLGLHLFTANYFAVIVLTPLFMFWMHQSHLDRIYRWYGLAFLPLSIVVTLLWLWQVRSLRHDMYAASQGRTPRLGLPHHGVILVMAIQGLVTFFIFCLQIVWTIRLEMQRELIYFGIAKLIELASYTLVLHVLRWIERPIVPPK